MFFKHGQSCLKPNSLATARLAQTVIQESQDVSPFPTGGHKAARNRYRSMAKANTNNKKDPQKKHRLGTAGKKLVIGGLKLVSRYQPHSLV